MDECRTEAVITFPVVASARMVAAKTTNASLPVATWNTLACAIVFKRTHTKILHVFILTIRLGRCVQVIANQL